MKDKLYSGIMGLVCGDALGVPFEFSERSPKSVYPLIDMTGYGAHNQPLGTWSDDSALTLATIQSIVDKERIDCNDIMKNFFEWFRFGRFSANGEVFDIGATTFRAIDNYIHGCDALDCGGTDVNDNGNGSLMRILPLAYVDCTEQDIINVSSVTHAHEISTTACRIYVAFAKKLLNDVHPNRALLEIKNELKYNEAIFSQLFNVPYFKRAAIKSTGYVVATLEAAIWCFMRTSSYRKCVSAAVRLGGDTDTIAAIAGGLAGIYYGVDGEAGIPSEWIKLVDRYSIVDKLCKRFKLSPLVQDKFKL